MENFTLKEKLEGFQKGTLSLEDVTFEELEAILLEVEENEKKADSYVIQKNTEATKALQSMFDVFDVPCKCSAVYSRIEIKYDVLGDSFYDCVEISAERAILGWNGYFKINFRRGYQTFETEKEFEHLSKKMELVNKLFEKFGPIDKLKELVFEMCQNNYDEILKYGSLNCITTNTQFVKNLIEKKQIGEIKSQIMSHLKDGNKFVLSDNRFVTIESIKNKTLTFYQKGHRSGVVGLDHNKRVNIDTFVDEFARTLWYMKKDRGVEWSVESPEHLVS
jgi:hypothetical protein